MDLKIISKALGKKNIKRKDNIPSTKEKNRAMAPLNTSIIT
jgi:hypothetical protein